ncbi:hypothetical protein BHE74_00058273, partial [Ensete ventricosum]
VTTPTGTTPQVVALQAAAPAGVSLQAITVADGCPYRGPWPQPIVPLSVLVRGRPSLQGAWSWPSTLVEGLTMADHPLSSLPSLQKRSKNV